VYCKLAPRFFYDVRAQASMAFSVGYRRYKPASTITIEQTSRYQWFEIERVLIMSFFCE
jgi:hypothetical protein